MTARSICIQNVEIIRQLTRSYAYEKVIRSYPYNSVPIQCNNVQIYAEHFVVGYLSFHRSAIDSDIYLTKNDELFVFTLYVK